VALGAHKFDVDFLFFTHVIIVGLMKGLNRQAWADTLDPRNELSGTKVARLIMPTLIMPTSLLRRVSGARIVNHSRILRSPIRYQKPTTQPHRRFILHRSCNIRVF
jgi:hypothetical protein